MIGQEGSEKSDSKPGNRIIYSDTYPRSYLDKNELCSLETWKKWGPPSENQRPETD